MKPRVLFYVQHLLGIGHLRRAEALTAAMSAAGLDVTVALGSPRLPEVPFAAATVAQLPPATIREENFSVLIDEHGNVADEAWRERRRDILLGVLRENRPDVLMLELFPFGRRQFRFELIPLLEAARAMSPRPHIVSSVRDILVESPKPGRAEEAAEIARRYFNTVLVHGDPDVIEFGATFGPVNRIADLIRYTGYVAGAAPGSTADKSGEVIVSAGGGATGAPLLAAALAARPATVLRDAVWRVLTGPDLPAPDFAELAAQANARTIVERFRPDLPALLRASTLSISRAGYNTTMDILQSGTRAVVVPFETREETEQRLRSDLLASRGLLTVVPASELSAARLAEAIDGAMARPRPDTSGINLDGARQTAVIVGRLVAPVVQSV